MKFIALKLCSLDLFMVKPLTYANDSCSLPLSLSLARPILVINVTFEQS